MGRRWPFLFGMSASCSKDPPKAPVDLPDEKFRSSWDHPDRRRRSGHKTVTDGDKRDVHEADFSQGCVFRISGLRNPSIRWKGISGDRKSGPIVTQRALLALEFRRYQDKKTRSVSLPKNCAACHQTGAHGFPPPGYGKENHGGGIPRQVRGPFQAGVKKNARSPLRR